MQRDFTYIEDLVEGIVRRVDAVSVSDQPVGVSDSLSRVAPHYIVSSGSGRPVKLMDFVRTIETNVGVEAKLYIITTQKRDARETKAHSDLLLALANFKPSILVEMGAPRFFELYLSDNGGC